MLRSPSDLPVALRSTSEFKFQTRRSRSKSIYGLHTVGAVILRRALCLAQEGGRDRPRASTAARFSWVASGGWKGQASGQDGSQVLSPRANCSTLLAWQL